MPELDLDKLGGLMPDLEGYLRDPDGYILAKYTDGKIQWFDSRGEKPRVFAKPEDIKSVERASEPHAYVVNYKDGLSIPCIGSQHKPDQIRILPEQKHAPILDLDAIIDYNCPEFKRQVFRDHLSGNRYIDLGKLGIKREIDPTNPIQSLGSDSGSFLVLISDADVDVIRCMERWSLQMWGKAWSPPWKYLEAYMVNISRDNLRNFFLEYIQANTPERMGSMESVAYEFFIHLGMTAPGLTEEEAERYLIWVCRAYLLATIERQFHPTVVDISLCIYGNERTGKSSTFRFLGGDWYRITNESIKNQQKFMESVTGGAVVEFNDDDQHRTHPEAFKGFIDRDVMQYRKAYDKREDRYPVPFVSTMTTNDHHPIINLTGARRTLPLCFDKPTEQRPKNLSEECRQAIWSRAYRDYINGNRWRDGEEEIIPLAKKMQEYAARENPNEDVLWTVLSLYPNEPGFVIGSTDLKEKLARELCDRQEAKATFDMLRTYPEKFGLEEGVFRNTIDKTPTRGFRRIRRQD